MRSGPPPFFEVGKTYFDNKSEYTIIEATRKGLRLKRPNGSEELERDIELKARIHKRIVSEGGMEASKLRQSFLPRKSRSGTLERFFAIIAEIVEQYSKNSSDYMTHDEIANALVEHPEAGPLLEQFAREDSNQKTALWWAGSRIAFFSQQWTVRRDFPYDGPFERQRLTQDYDYRKRKISIRPEDPDY
ncbi:MAG: hypothetical protein M3Y57_03205 [Acidobacteriota bacterium]|nr:hypothetical protein [Acidobacteriota bacterium]